MSELLPLEFDKIIGLAAEALSRVSGRICRLEQIQSLSAPERTNLSLALLPAAMMAKRSRLS